MNRILKHLWEHRKNWYGSKVWRICLGACLMNRCYHSMFPIRWLITSTDDSQFTWLWWWLPLRLSKRRSMSSPTVLLSTTLTRTIISYRLMTWLLGRVSRNSRSGRKKVGRWNEQSAVQTMCDAEKAWHERSFRASGAFGSRQNLPFNNWKSHFPSLFFSQPCTMIKTFFHSPGSQLKTFMSTCILANLLHSKLAKNGLNLTVLNACSCRKTWHGCLSSSLLQKLQITPP